MRTSELEIRDAPARTPDGERLIVFGDIHGQKEMLDDLLARIETIETPEPGLRDRYVFLGDYIDRGPDSAGVVERLCDLRDGANSAVFLLGNHEDMMRGFLVDPTTRAALTWQANGGNETIASYGVEPNGRIADDEALRDSAAALAGAIPERHTRFLHDLLPYYRAGGYIFAHAGLRPGLPLDDQRTQDLIWIRHLFLDSDADFGGIVVHGHTPAYAPEVKSNRLNLDTGAGKGGYLTAALLWGTSMAFLHAGF